MLQPILLCYVDFGHTSLSSTCHDDDDDDDVLLAGCVDSSTGTFTHSHKQRLFEILSRRLVLELGLTHVVSSVFNCCLACVCDDGCGIAISGWCRLCSSRHNGCNAGFE